ncbi:uncharacterized protein METZ01_LOCUS61800 [marine metagenome]|uniref:Acyloxyacyl hydrolase n=1 Tax=marine metagenome TaxID=408172 RepID=A0A381SY93_9ZZZZ
MLKGSPLVKNIISALILLNLGFFNSPIFASEYRVGLSMHDMERRIEGGAALSIEKIFDRPTWWHEFAGRPHLGTQISLANNTHLFYFGSTWNLFQKGKFSGELAFGGAIHTGNEEIKNGELGYGCKANFRELIAFGYDINDKQKIQFSAQHMSNGSLCDPNQGLTTVGIRFAWKID